MKRESRRADVLVVGAGPTGLALALALQRLGVDFRIIDKEPARSVTSKAIGLQTRVSEVLAWMGVADRFFERGLTPGGGIAMHAGGRQLLVLRFERFIRRLEREGGKGAFVPRMILIPQSETEAILEETLEARGSRVERRSSFLSFLEEGESVLSRVARSDGTEEEIESSYLVSCEGAHSVIRKQAGFSFSGKTYPMQLLMADARLDWERSHDMVHVFFHPDGPCAAMPLPGSIWRLIVDSGPRAGDEAPEVTLALMQRLFADRTGDRRVRLSDPTWLTSFRINCRMVERFRAGRVFLAGDAAHIHSPTGGQGIATGIQDAWNLAWKLAQVLQRGAPDVLLDTFEEERLPIAREVLASTDTNTKVFLGVTPAARLFRDLVFLPLLSTGLVQDRLFRRVSQLAMHYRGRGLSHSEDRRPWLRTRVRAGHRTPDVVFRDAAADTEISLFRLLEQGRLVALAAGGAPAARAVAALRTLGCEAFVLAAPAGPPSVDGVPCLVDVYGDFRRLYGARGEFLYVIRPDGYAGLFLRPIREEALRGYLGRLFAPGQIARALEAGQ